MYSYSSVFSFPPKLTTAQLRHPEIGIDATARRLVQNVVNDAIHNSPVAQISPCGNSHQI